MKYLIFIVISLLFGCSKESKLNNHYKEINVSLSLVNKKFICIKIENNTKNKIYIPECKVTGAGLRILGINDCGKFIDLSDKAKYNSLFCTIDIKKEFPEIYKSININNIESLNISIRDSIALSIVKKIKYRNSRLLHYTKEWASRQLEWVLFLEPGKSYSNYFYLIDSLIYKRLDVFYSYPYPYPVIKNGPGSLSKELLMNSLKNRDSLSFNYPGYINGYKLYNKVIISDPIIIER